MIKFTHTILVSEKQRQKKGSETPNHCRPHDEMAAAVSPSSIIRARRSRRSVWTKLRLPSHDCQHNYELRDVKGVASK